MIAGWVAGWVGDILRIPPQSVLVLPDGGGLYMHSPNLMLAVRAAVKNLVFCLRDQGCRLIAMSTLSILGPRKNVFTYR